MNYSHEIDLLQICVDETLVRILAFLNLGESMRWSGTCRAFREAVPAHLDQALALIRSTGYYPALGDEVVWQRLCCDDSDDSGKSIDFTSLVSEVHVDGWIAEHSPSTCQGPTQRQDALDISQLGMVVKLPEPLVLGLEWTVCVWTLFSDGRPHREGFVQPEEWIEGEHALTGSPNDDQHVFYSEGRGGWLGCYCDDIDETEYEENLYILDPDYGPGFFSSQYSFRNISDGWHFIAAVGSRWRLGMGWTAESSNGNGCTRYYVDGELVGSIPFNLQEPVQYIGNVSGDDSLEDRTQPWGRIADFRIYRRALKPRELEYIMSAQSVAGSA